MSNWYCFTDQSCLLSAKQHEDCDINWQQLFTFIHELVTVIPKIAGTSHQIYCPHVNSVVTEVEGERMFYSWLWNTAFWVVDVQYACAAHTNV